MLPDNISQLTCLNACCAAPVSFDAVTSSSPFSNLYYAVELPGVFKALSLTSYSPSQAKHGYGSSEDEQYSWLQQELAQVRPGPAKTQRNCAQTTFAGHRQALGPCIESGWPHALRYWLLVVCWPPAS
jgi:hypothetical protein